MLSSQENNLLVEGGTKELTTLQRVLKQVYGRTKQVSETQSLSEFLFKGIGKDTTDFVDGAVESAATENAATA